MHGSMIVNCEWSVVVLWPVTSDQAGSPHRLRLWQQWPRVLGPLPVSSTTAPLPDHILVHCINQTKPGPRLANIGHLLLFGKGVPTMPPQSASPCPPGRQVAAGGRGGDVVSAVLATARCLGQPWHWRWWLGPVWRGDTGH